MLHIISKPVNRLNVLIHVTVNFLSIQDNSFVSPFASQIVASLKGHLSIISESPAVHVIAQNKNRRLRSQLILAAFCHIAAIQNDI